MTELGLGAFLERSERNKQRFLKKLKNFNYENREGVFKPEERNPDKKAYFLSGNIRKKQMREKALNKDLRRWF